ncbi:josephin-1 isoform X1 [Rhipicephalus microplus]|uniref:josephin-1 isoform X1 n=2 Tax=Rhipicephalus microplus TaxID=6941 RepID=UPI003F6AB463
MEASSAAAAAWSLCREGIPMYQCLKFVDRFIRKDHKPGLGSAGGSGGAAGAGHVYHERQVKELCALHALNNLFQDGQAFTKGSLDDICHRFLSPDHLVNPHKSMLGLGNYDVNVIMSALQLRGYEAIWFDKRKDPSCIDLAKIVGFILNVPSEMKFGFLQFPLSRKHWIAVREVNGTFYNLDSKLEAPAVIGKSQELLQYLREQIKCKDREIFIVVTQDIGRVKGCYIETSRETPPRQPSQQSVAPTREHVSRTNLR